MATTSEILCRRVLGRLLVAVDLAWQCTASESWFAGTTCIPAGWCSLLATSKTCTSSKQNVHVQEATLSG